MTRAHAGWLAVGGAWMLIGAACSQHDSTQVDPIASAGSGGVGGSNVKAGSSGAGGVLEPGPTEPGVAGFRASQNGYAVDLTVPDTAWYLTCTERNAQLMKSVNGAWVPFQDDRPYYGFLNLNSRAYCVDGTYFPDRWLPAPCDTSSCLPMPDHVQLRASEYVQIGEAPSGDCGRDGGVAAFESGADRDAGRRPVPNIESRAAAAPLAVRVTYYGDHTCSSGALTVDVPVE